MKKYAKFVLSISLITLPGYAFAQSGVSADPALARVIANTDAQFAAALPAAMALDVPAPVIVRAAASRIQLTDITDKCTHGDEVVSAYPALYKLFPSEENSRVIKVFRFADSKGAERRIEVYFTGGDWMQYGLTYLITNSGENKNQASAFFVSELSTPDREDGAVAPVVNPFDAGKLSEFIVGDFLDVKGNVKIGLSSVASAPVLP